jgi:hypothetical protein
MTVTLTTYEVLQRHVGWCREWISDCDQCTNPSEFVLWGKLIPQAGLGPRCYDHAANHVGHHALSGRSGYALINLRDLARDLEDRS